MRRSPYDDRQRLRRRPRRRPLTVCARAQARRTCWHDLFGCADSDHSLVDVSQLIRLLASRNRPGPFDQLAGYSHGGLGVAVPVGRRGSAPTTNSLSRACLGETGPG